MLDPIIMSYNLTRLSVTYTIEYLQYPMNTTYNTAFEETFSLFVIHNEQI